MNCYSSFSPSQVSGDNLEVAIFIGAEVYPDKICFPTKEMWRQYRAIVSNSEPGFIQSILQKIRLGDKIHAVTAALKIPHCESCAARKRKLNGE